ncbi:hypothetical protein [Haloprofundus halobius]|uniref:hypothetical protein n=1 Tax=Haloprofundus halobius TaxID=2876194 RepID=UPI001CCB750C|nr:hypothetical protein [Haloprofundus halobius]
MVRRRFLPSLVALLTVVPTPVLAQAGVETPAAGSWLVDLVMVVFLLALITAFSAAFAVALAIPVLLVSEFVYADSYVRDLERRIYDVPVRSGLLGIAATLVGITGFVLFAIVVMLLTEFGVPDPVGLVVAVPVLAGVLFFYVGSTVGTVVLGSYLLRRVASGESNLWLALVVGAVIANIPLLGFFLSLPALFVSIGAMVDRWWSNRRDGSSGPGPRRSVDG